MQTNAASQLGVFFCIYGQKRGSIETATLTCETAEAQTHRLKRPNVEKSALFTTRTRTNKSISYMYRSVSQHRWVNAALFSFVSCLQNEIGQPFLSAKKADHVCQISTTKNSSVKFQKTCLAQVISSLKSQRIDCKECIDPEKGAP